MTRLAVFCCCLGSMLAVVRSECVRAQDAAYFWLSTQAKQSTGPATPSPVQLNLGESTAMHIWGRPMRGRKLRALSLNLVASAPGIDFVDGTFVVHNENLLRSTRRFQFVHDSSAEDPDGETDVAELISESDGIEEADAVNGLLGFGLLGFMPEPPLVIQGIGGTCPSLDTNCVMASDGIPAWRIATVELEAVAPGDVELYLQIGDDGMRHEYLPGDYNGDSEVDGDDYSVWRSTFGAMADVTAGLPADGNRDGTVDAADYTFWRDHVGAVSVLEGSAESFARFGTDPGGGLEPIYNAGFMGDREITLPMDNFDAIIHVGIISGNAAGIPEHGLLNAIVPEISCQSLVFLGMTSLALFRPSSVVARRSKHRTTLPPELSQANSAAQFLHQDGQ